jgi:Flp pilus assembly protein TadG
MSAKNGNTETVGGAMRGRRKRLLHKARGGQALVEFAMIVPLLLLLVVLTVDFGGLINAWITVQNTTRAAADYAILSGSSAGSPALATSTSLQNLISADMSGLPNVVLGSNPTICVRENNNGNTTFKPLEMPAGVCGNYATPPVDGETIPGNTNVAYITVAVDITYTYTSFFTGSSFMGLPLTALPNSIHQRAVMRMQ